MAIAQEVYNETDRAEINRIIGDLRDSYEERRTEALRTLAVAQRQVNRAEHELHRIERHLARIETFTKNNLEGQGA